MVRLREQAFFWMLSKRLCNTPVKPKSSQGHYDLSLVVPLQQQQESRSWLLTKKENIKNDNHSTGKNAAPLKNQQTWGDADKATHWPSEAKNAGMCEHWSCFLTPKRITLLFAHRKGKWQQLPWQHWGTQSLPARGFEHAQRGSAIRNPSLLGWLHLGCCLLPTDAAWCGLEESGPLAADDLRACLAGFGYHDSKFKRQIVVCVVNC